MPKDLTTEEAEERKVGSATELMRMRLERLQRNIPVKIPPLKDDLRPPKPPPEFVRNVIGSTAAAGSAEFHIFRNNRRKETKRMEYIEAVARREEEAKDFAEAARQIKEAEERKTAKKRAKRLRQKARSKKAKKVGDKSESEESDDSGKDSEDDDDASQPKATEDSNKD